MELIDFLVKFAIIFFVTRFVVSSLVSWFSSSRNEENEIKEHLESIIHAINVEKHGEMVYWFDKNTDQFIAQGRSLDEIKEVLKKRFSGHMFLLDHTDYQGYMSGPDFELQPELTTTAIHSLIK